MRALATLALVGLLASSSALAAPGDVDTSFGTGGVTSTAAGPWSMAYDVVEQPDGKLVVAGAAFDSTAFGNAKFAVTRYLPNGTLDTLFGTNGVADTVVSPSSCCDILYTEATAVALQADGKILVAGQAFVDGAPTLDAGLVRYDSTGALDPTFGTGGILLEPIGSSFEALAVQADGRILAGGTGILARYHPDGSHDLTFGFGGVATTADIRDMVLLPGGSIITVGASGTPGPTGTSDAQIMKFDSAGSLDLTFGSAGIVTTDFGTVEVARAVAIAPNGDIVVGGGPLHLDPFEQFFGFLGRYDSSGNQDTGFAGTGTPGLATPISDVATLSDGRILVAGSMFYDFFGYPVGTGFLLDGYLADGSPDPAFAAPNTLTSIESMLVLPSSKVVVVGHLGNLAVPMTFGIARHLIDGVPGPPCGNGIVEGGEQCDDGNTTNGDCCSSSCEWNPVGTACGTASACAQPSLCDGAGTCAPGAFEPLTGCKTSTLPLQGKLVLKDNATDAKDVLVWAWRRGDETLASDLGDPTTDDDYTACLFTGATAHEIEIPAGISCNGKPCWKATSKGFKYKSKTTIPDGVKTLLLKEGAAGKATIILKGKGELLPMPSLPLTLPATIQLQSDTGTCWESTFEAEGVKKSTPEVFVGASSLP